MVNGCPIESRQARRTPARPGGWLTALVAFSLLATGPSTASAHQGDPNYRSELDGVVPTALGDRLDFSVGNYDDFIALSNRSGETVLVMGYRGEPYLRFLGNGQVEANTRSPAWFANRDRYAETAVPGAADPDAVPRWKTVATEGRYSWHDHRSHWMGKGVPPQVTDRSRRTEVFDYAIPIRVADRPAELTGTLFWVGSGGGAPVWPFVLLGGLVLGGVGWLLYRRRRERPEPGPSGS